MLVAYAERMTGQDHERWPDLLVLMGDQVYADDTSPAMKDFIRTRRDIHKGPKDQVADFEEYTRLYRESWSEPTVRWLLSTLPTAMIFDDHDVRDDWNTSHAWRVDMQQTDWWEERITGALMSYWIYQHLGNLVARRAGRQRHLRGRPQRPRWRGGPRARSPRPPTARPTGRRARCGRTGGTSVRCGCSSSIPAAAGCWPTAAGR